MDPEPNLIVGEIVEQPPLFKVVYICFFKYNQSDTWFKSCGDPMVTPEAAMEDTKKIYSLGVDGRILVVKVTLPI